MMHGGNGQVSVPPGFRFHPTDEELLYYYLKKKVSYEAIDLDVIREIDLNKLEPWDLREKCRIGSGPQNDWYFFSHKDKKYPTGTRTNRATMAGFWKATGRDKPIFFSNGKRIGMRKTLVFYTGRAPHGQKTDWIMHEYRLDDDSSDIQQEEGWVVCRVFKKKHLTRGFQAPEIEEGQEEDYAHQARSSILLGNNNNNGLSQNNFIAKQHLLQQQSIYGGYPFDGSINLPHLSSPDSGLPHHVSPMPPVTSTFLTPMTPLSTIDAECSHNSLRLTSMGVALTNQPGPEHQKFGGDWLFLDKLLTNYHTMDHQHKGNHHHQSHQVQVTPINMDASGHQQHHHQRFPFQYLGCEPDLLKYSK